VLDWREGDGRHSSDQRTLFRDEIHELLNGRTGSLDPLLVLARSLGQGFQLLANPAAYQTLAPVIDKLNPDR
jgi:hypothetical protein